MTAQEACLNSPHHFTYLGDCYMGTNLTLGISNPQNPQPVTHTVTSVPEPSSIALLAAVVAVVLFRKVL